MFFYDVEFYDYIEIFIQYLQWVNPIYIVKIITILQKNLLNNNLFKDEIKSIITDIRLSVSWYYAYVSSVW